MPDTSKDPAADEQDKGELQKSIAVSRIYAKYSSDAVADTKKMVLETRLKIDNAIEDIKNLEPKKK